MKKPIIIVLGIILFSALGAQTYRVYRLHQEVSQLRAGNPFTDDFLPKQTSDDAIVDKDMWNPSQELQRMHNEMEQLFNNSFSRFRMNSDVDSLIKIPTLDLREETDRYIVSLDLPGAKTASLDVKLEGQELFISVKTENSSEQNGGDKSQYHKRERFSGTFQRSLTLPGPVKESAMTTDYSNGVLTITIPKA